MAWTLKSLEWVKEVSRTANPKLEGVLMLIYQLKIEIKPYKPDEFIDSLSSLVTSIRREKGCLDFRVCQDSEEENTYLLLAEWKTRKAMEKHFKTHEFELLIGTARVLGKTFKMSIAEVSKTGGLELARKQIVSQQQKSGVGQ